MSFGITNLDEENELLAQSARNHGVNNAKGVQMNMQQAQQLQRAHENLGKLLELVDELLVRLAELESRLKAVESKRGPGRPRKTQGVLSEH